MRLALSPFVAAFLLGAPTASAQLNAPPPMTQGGPGTVQPSSEDLQKQETTKRLNEAESSDSKRNFELIYIDGQVGGSFLDLAAINADNLKLKETGAAGPAFSLGAGVRVLLFYFGARGRFNALSNFNLWQINAEAGIKIPISAIDFMAGIHGGYSFVGSLSDDNGVTTSAPNVTTKNSDVSLGGANLGADVAVDYYVNPYFSVGVGVLGDVLFLSRSKLSVTRDAAAIVVPEVAEKDGSAAGLQVGGMLRLGLHLGL